MSRALQGPAVVEPDERDAYFEMKVRELTSPLEHMGLLFDPVDVLLLDPEAYKQVRLNYLSEVQSEVIDQMDADSRRRVGEVLDLIPKTRVVPLFGAGMSVPSGYPGWGKFLRDCADSHLDLGSVQKMLDAGDFEKVATLVRNIIGAHAFEERMGVFGMASAPSETLFVAVELFSRCHLVTTNFDSLIEGAFKAMNLDLNVVPGSDTWNGWAAETPDSEQTLLKLHGTSKRPNARVILEEEYDLAYGADGPVRRDLAALFGNSSLVFLGASLKDDRSVSLAHELLTGKAPGSTPRHHAFLAAEERTPKRDSFLGERNIFAIWYPNPDGDHQTLGDLLWWMKEELANRRGT